MNLIDTLQRLSELLPERFFPDDGDYRVRLWNSRERILMRDGTANSYGLMVLEQGLRLEIEGRGWHWSIESGICTPAGWCYSENEAYGYGADIPVQGLALALIAALEAEAQP